MKPASRRAGVLGLACFTLMLLAGTAAASGSAVQLLGARPAADVGVAGTAAPSPSASCAATVLRIGNADLVPSRGDTRSCVSTQANIPHLTLLAVELSLASAQTQGPPSGDVSPSGASIGPSAAQMQPRARVEVAEVIIGTVAVRGLEASAAAACAGDTVARSGRSQVLSVTAGGRRLGLLDRPVNLALPGVGTLHLNEVADTPDGRTVRTLRLESLLGDIVVGEARAGLGSSACSAGTGPAEQATQPPADRPPKPPGPKPPGPKPPGPKPPGPKPPGPELPPVPPPGPSPAPSPSLPPSSSPPPGESPPVVAVPLRPSSVESPHGVRSPALAPGLVAALFVASLAVAAWRKGSGGGPFAGGPGGPGSSGLGVPPLPGAREVRTGFAPMGDAGSAVHASTALAAGRPYWFWLELGPPVGSQAREQRARAGDPPTSAGLSVALFDFDGELRIEPAESRGELALDPEGRARVARHGRVPRGAGAGAELLGKRVFFPVRTPRRRGDHRLRCNLYCGQTLVQSLLVHARVRHPLWQLLAEGPGRLRRSSRTLIGHEVDFALSRTLDPAHLAKLQPHALSILMNGDEGTHGFRLVGRGGFRSSATFDDAEVQEFGDRLREVLRSAACGDGEVPWDRYRTPAEAQLADDLIRFARRGYRVWSGLVRRLAQEVPGSGPPERRLAPLLRSSTRIQFVSRMGARHRLPASMIYDAPLDANAPATLCPAFLDALSADAPLEDTACFQGRCPSWGDRHVVCPSGFWGFRHVIGMPQSLGSDAGGALDVATEITFDDAPTFVVGVSTDPGFVERSGHEQALRSLYPGVDWRYGDTRDGVLDLLEQTQPHLVYLYCHGGSAKGSAFIEVGRPGDPVVTGDDLMYRVWWEETHPLVFINGCHTSAVSPETALELVTAFVERQASGVIGTEVTVFEHLAGRFAEACLGRLAQGTSIGDAIRSTRLALLKAGNPLGLIYVAFVTDELRMVRAGAEGGPAVRDGIAMAGSGAAGVR